MMANNDELQRRQLKANIFASYWGASTALLIPLAIAAATYWFNQTQLYINQRQFCLTQHATLADKLYGGKDVPDDQRAMRSAAIFDDTKLLLTDCNRVNLPLTQLEQFSISDVAQNTPSADVRNAAIQVLKTNAQLTGEASSPALQAALTPPPRIYISVGNKEQFDQATSLRAKLQQTQIDNSSILVPPIQTKNSGEAKTVLRCFTHDDCAQADSIVKALNGMLRVPPVEKDDLSSHPQLSAGNRPRHYELWFAPGPIELRAS